MEQSPHTVAKAKTLRRSLTEAEKKLWGYLRKKTLNGYRFRRQAPIPPYIADFLCFSHKLIIEIDGATHGDAHEMEYDQGRSADLEAKGYKIIRFWNDDVYKSLDAVLDAILIALIEQKTK